MARTLIDVDEEQLAAAQKVLKTEAKKDTVNAALRQVTALAARRRDLQRLISGRLRSLFEAGLVATCGVIELEVWATRTGAEFDQVRTHWREVSALHPGYLASDADPAMQQVSSSSRATICGR
jgi:hypothetical protein